MAFVDLNDSVIAQVRQAADIVDVIGAVTPLKLAGKSHKGLCPFHREKSPSFTVDRGKGLFYCFGCGAGGDVFKFLMLAERFTFPEAVEHVANKFGVPLPRKQKGTKDADREDLVSILDEAAEAYQQALAWRPNLADSYLKNREIDEGVAAAYGFGYAPDSWDYILSRLGGKFLPARLEAAGLALPRKTGNGFYDRFRNRLMIPIHSEGGTLLGFGGRTLDGSDPKYLNSPEGPLFNKSQILFNLHRVKDSIRRNDRAILVEGYFDAIALDRARVSGVVASMGTSLTPGQAGLLRKYTRNVVISYDGDTAGRKATLRAAPILLASGFQVSVIDAGDGNDPDSLIQKKGVDHYLMLLGAPKDIFSFALEVLVANPSTMTSSEKSKVLEELIPLLTAVNDPVAKTDATHRVADGLRLEFETLWPRVRGRSGQAERRPDVAPISTGEKEILRMALQEGLAPGIFERLTADHFDDPENKAVYFAMKQAISSDGGLDFSQIGTHLRKEAELTRLSELALGDEVTEADTQSIGEKLRLMEKRFLERRLREIQLETQEAERGGDHERVQTLLLEKSTLSRQFHALK